MLEILRLVVQRLDQMVYGRMSRISDGNENLGSATFKNAYDVTTAGAARLALREKPYGLF